MNRYYHTEFDHVFMLRDVKLLHFYAFFDGIALYSMLVIRIILRMVIMGPDWLPLYADELTSIRSAHIEHLTNRTDPKFQLVASPPSDVQINRTTSKLY